MPRELILAMVLGGVVIFFTRLIRQLGRMERRAVEAAQRLLPHHVREGLAHRFTGKVHGVEVTLRLYQTSGSDEAQGGLMSEVLLPHPPGILLELRPQDAVQSHLATRGLAKDVIIGDAAFDQAFVVEMAPASLAPLVFDADLRRRLIELSPLHVRPREGGGLRLGREDWDEARFAALIEAGALLATRLQQAGGAEAVQAERWGASHTTARATEQAELEKVRAARASWTVRNVLLLAGALLVLLVLRLLLS